MPVRLKNLLHENRLLVLLLGCGVTPLLAIVALAWLLNIDELHLEGVSSISFAELRQSPTFTAVVQTKLHETRPVISIYGATNATEAVRVDLKKEDGKELTLYQENPTPEEVLFVLQLKEGTRCTFPNILTNWR